ncbi:WXG100 family type VII secretion target [Natronoglycomyces albus]|uniref:ESAT-6-like protein n=1 Tax=Natronoglycomyces albus TaxID=2811108 RepID=A0A895XL07_9ACTN|nr:WXG100 family type VII secretion target [Natronoglycomyces albus]QSB06014.1 WXG100 family type VII secretion target [Natronoglycomyces albus]
MGGIAMDAATVRKAASDVRTTRSDVDGELNGIRGICDNLAAGWTGQAGASFQNAMNHWDQNANRLLTALDDIADMLDGGANQQEAQDQEQAAEFNKFDAL